MVARSEPLIVIKHVHVVFSDHDRNTLPFSATMSSKLQQLLGDLRVRSWLDIATLHYPPISRKLEFSFHLHFKNSRTESAVRAMKDFLVGSN